MLYYLVQFRSGRFFSPERYTTGYFLWQYQYDNAHLGVLYYVKKNITMI
jgi:hypothetical protein